MQARAGYLASYSRTMQRVYWAEFIDNQLRPPQRFRASIVGTPSLEVTEHRPPAAAEQIAPRA